MNLFKELGEALWPDFTTILVDDNLQADQQDVGDRYGTMLRGEPRKNYTPEQLNSVQASIENGKLLVGMEIYNQYANMHESFEDFSDRMSEDHGSDWVYKYLRK